MLRGKRGFDLLFEKGKIFGGPGISLLVLRSGFNAPSRMAVCVSKRSGKAVHRNRLKRITRESVDELIPRLRGGCYIALFPGKSFEERAHDGRVDTLEKLFKKADLLTDVKSDG